MDIRNPTFNQHGTVDVEIDHPDYGWIPFTASPLDSEAHGRDIYARVIAGEFGEISAYLAPEFVPPQPLDPVEKLRAFLAENPDVAALL